MYQVSDNQNKVLIQNPQKYKRTVEISSMMKLLLVCFVLFSIFYSFASANDAIKNSKQANSSDSSTSSSEEVATKVAAAAPGSK